MRTDRSIAGETVNPFDWSTGERSSRHQRRRSQARTPWLEALVVAALVAIEMAVAVAVAVAFAPVVWPFS